MISIYGCGSNLHGQLRPNQDSTTPLSFSIPIPLQLLPENADEKPIDELVASSDCQVVLRASCMIHPGLYVTLRRVRPVSAEHLHSIGFPLPHLDILKQASSGVVKLLGRSHFVAHLDQAGRIVSLSDNPKTSKDTFVDATIDGHGRILAICRTDHKLHLFTSLENVLQGNSTIVEIDHPLTPQTKLYSGAAHSLVHISPDILYSLGSDNRFFQLGHSKRNAGLSKAEQITIFEGGSPIRKIACGDLHSAVITEDGGSYVFGSDAQGQCGGFCEAEPSLVDFEVEEGQEQPDVLDVACGSRHTVVLTDQGVYATGSSTLHF